MKKKLSWFLVKINSRRAISRSIYSLRKVYRVYFLSTFRGSTPEEQQHKLQIKKESMLSLVDHLDCEWYFTRAKIKVLSKPYKGLILSNRVGWMRKKLTILKNKLQKYSKKCKMTSGLRKSRGGKKKSSLCGEFLATPNVGFGKTPYYHFQNNM